MKGREALVQAEVCGDQECESSHHGGCCSDLRPSDRETDPGRKMRNATRHRGRGGVGRGGPCSFSGPCTCSCSRFQTSPMLIQTCSSTPPMFTFTPSRKAAVFPEPLRRFLEPGVTWERTLPSRSSRDVRTHQSTHPKQEKKIHLFSEI